jgi:alpha-N-arabinofuranosidase
MQSCPTRPTARYGDAPVVDTVLTHDEQSGSLVLFAVNRSQSESVALIGDVAAFGALQVGAALVLADADPSATNTVDDQDRVVPVPLHEVELLDGELRVELPPLSWVTVNLDRAGSPTLR